VPVIDDDMVRAFLTGDRAYFVSALDLQPWQDSPLANRHGECNHGHPLDASMPGYGCSDQHEAHALRRRLIAELERRGRRT
jgi:hypothetical protein